jgi:hypothetical protein
MNKNGMTGTGTGTEDNSVEEKLDSIRDSVKGYVERGAQKADQIKNKAVEVKDQAMNRWSERIRSRRSASRSVPVTSACGCFAADRSVLRPCSGSQCSGCAPAVLRRAALRSRRRSRAAS